MNEKPEQTRAVALKYAGSGAPTVTAKGDQAVAQAILERAAEHNVPIQENAELVQLLGQLELGDEIPRELYVAVAEVLAFAYWLSGKTPHSSPEAR